MNDFVLSSSNSPANKLSPAKQALLEIIRTPVKNMGARRRIILSDSENDIIEQMSHAAKAVEKSPILAKTIEAVLAENEKPKRRGKGSKKGVVKTGEGTSSSGLGKRKAVEEVIMIMDDAPSKKKSKKEQQKAPGKGKNKKKSAKSSSSESDSDSSEDSSNDDSSDSDTEDQKEIGHIILAKKAFVNLAQCGKCRDLQKTVVSVYGEGEEQAIQIVNCKPCLEGNETMAKKFRKMFSIVKKDKKGKRRAEFDDGKLTYAKYQLCIGQCQNCATNQAAINAVAKGPTKKTKLLQVVNCNSCVKSNKKMNKLFWEKFSSGGGTTVGKKWEGGGQRFFNKRR